MAPGEKHQGPFKRSIGKSRGYWCLLITCSYAICFIIGSTFLALTATIYLSFAESPGKAEAYRATVIDIREFSIYITILAISIENAASENVTEIQPHCSFIFQHCFGESRI